MPPLSQNGNAESLYFALRLIFVIIPVTGNGGYYAKNNDGPNGQKEKWICTAAVL